MILLEKSFLSPETAREGNPTEETGKKFTWEKALSLGHVFGPPHCDFSTDPPVKPNPDGTYPTAVPGVTALRG